MAHPYFLRMTKNVDIASNIIFPRLRSTSHILLLDSQCHFIIDVSKALLYLKLDIVQY